MSKVFVIIPAGGTGKRIGGEIPKQYMKFHERELIAYTLEVFQLNTKIDHIIVSAQPEYFDLLEQVKAKNGFWKILKIVEGGSERQYSVYNALLSINAEEDDLVLVHDAARPLLSQNILDDIIETAKLKGNAVAAIKAKDTLVNGTDVIVNYINRGKINYIQTPQAFKYSVLLRAMQKAAEESFVGTDESMLVTRLGESVNLVEGSSLNFKITTESDVELFHLITSRNG